MIIDKIIVRNYRNYKETDISFNEEINIIVGANNSGKTNILHIISLLSTEQKLCIDDFNKNVLFNEYIHYKEKSPIIEIEYFIKHTMNYKKMDSGFSRLENFVLYNENGNIAEDESNQFILNAKIILKFELDSKYTFEYKNSMKNTQNYDFFMRNLKKFESYYKLNFYSSVSNEIIDKKIVKNIFNIEKIDANRNVEDITINTKKYVKSKILDNKLRLDSLNDEINSKIKNELNAITESINDDIKKDQQDIGVTNGRNNFISTFEFDSDFTEFFKYELENCNFGYALPLDNNGLGYNNLIYIRNSINLKNSDEFNLLLIEEPEAHLHPNMQYKLIKYIESYRNKNSNSNQIFITTHSSNITASANIDDIILIDYHCDSSIQDVKCINLKNNFNSQYIKKHYNVDITQNELDKNKRYLHKFLDVTRSDVLFANKVILVEGLSEKIFIPHAFEMKYKDKLVNRYISIIEVGGVTFKNFLPLFLGSTKKVLCISDVDYNYIDNSSFKNSNFRNYRIEKLANMGSEIYKKCSNYYFCTQKNGGSTFEKELFLDNYVYKSRMMLYNIFTNSKLKEIIIKNYKRCIEFSFWKNEAETEINDNRIWNSIKELVSKFESYYNTANGDEEKHLVEKFFFCELFYKYVKSKKGDFALDICLNNWIEHPVYIMEGLCWLVK